MTKILFLATEDWFVRSHFLPLLRRAREEGFEVVVAARDSGALSSVEDVRIINTPFARGSLKPWEVGRQLAHLRRLLDNERPDIVHAIALKPIALLILSRYRRAGRVLALTGRGFLGVGKAPWTTLVSWRLKRSIRTALRDERTVLLVENDADRRWVGASEAQTVLMPGAGVDVETFAPEPEAEPTLEPELAGAIVVGVVGRLIRSKGVDVAVDAVQQLRARGVDVVLRIAGAADPHNPEHVSETELARWRALPGVEMLGRVADVAGFWRGAHIACLPSRGGEGLPRSLLEAAACARPIVTTDAPGCADFVGEGGIGFVAPRDDVGALAEAVQALAQDAGLRERMGQAGRAKVIAGYTEHHAADAAASAWRAVLRK